MSEEEYTIEMLCCLPKELLISKLKGSDKIPNWLKGIDKNIVSKALEVYDSSHYVNQRNEMMKYI